MLREQSLGVSRSAARSASSLAKTFSLSDFSFKDRAIGLWKTSFVGEEIARGIGVSISISRPQCSIICRTNGALGCTTAGTCCAGHSEVVDDERAGGDMTTALLQLSTFDESNPQGYDDQPKFEKGIWPFLVSRQQSIGRIVTWEQRKPSLLGRQRKETPPDALRVTELGPMHGLSSDSLKSLCERSSRGGAFNVLFETSDSDLLRGLIGLYRRPPEFKEDSADSRVPNPARDLADRSLVPGVFMFAFGHDGDPACIFGDGPKLRSLMQHD